MGNTATPADIEHVLALGVPGVYAPPVPPDMQPPYSAAFATGGSRSDYVRDVRYVDIDTWAATEGEAIADACALVPAVETLVGQTIDGATVERVSVTTLPYVNPDPNRPDVSRATAAYEIVIKAVIS